MNTNIVALISLVLFGFAICEAGNIQLSVYTSSNAYWIAVAPIGGSLTTTTIELQQHGSSSWNIMEANPSWGYWQLAATGSAYKLPLSFRLTASNGEQLVLSSILTSINPGATVNTQAQYGSSSSSTSTQAPTSHATQAPTEHATAAPAHRHTQAPTQHATQAPTHHARHTQAPTQHATHAPTQHATQAPTRHATQAPTQAPSQAPTSHATQAPTQRATQAPTSHATQAPTQRATQAPTQKATSAPNTNLCAVTSTSTEPMKLLVALYIYPGSTWTQVANAAKAGVETIAIINPNNGPESSGPDSSYTTYMAQLASAGVTMIGYIHTSYGSRSISDVVADITTYATKYPGLSGIFIDEAATSSGEISYYQQVYNAIMSHSGYTNAILNPGTQPDQGYLAVSTSIVVFEDTASAWKNSFSSWVTCAPNAASKPNYKYHFAAIAYAASQSQMSSLISQFSAAGMGMVYVTDGSAGGNTYNSLPSFFSTEVSTIQSAN